MSVPSCLSEVLRRVYQTAGLSDSTHIETDRVWKAREHDAYETGNSKVRTCRFAADSLEDPASSREAGSLQCSCVLLFKYHLMCDFNVDFYGWQVRTGSGEVCRGVILGVSERILHNTLHLILLVYSWLKDSCA